MQINSSILILLWFGLSYCQEKSDTISGEHFIENGLIIASTLNNQNGNYNILDRMNYYGVPGVSLAIVNNDTIQFVKGYGLANREEKHQVNNSTLFQAASVSKPITCMTILKMAEANLISLHKDVNEYLKDWQIDYSDYNDSVYVTIEQILSHRSGLSRGSVAYYSIGEEIPKDEVDMLNATPPAKLEPVVLKFKPGSDWAYSGGGYTVLQKVIEDILGKSYEEAVDSIVFQPLQMKNSFFDPTFSDKNKNVAIGYNYDGRPVEGGWMILTELAAGGLWTTPHDIIKFINAVNHSLDARPNSFLKKESAEKMLQVGLFLNKDTEPPIYSFRGTNKGYRCEFIGFRENGKSHGAIVMTNSYNSRYLNQEILRSIAYHYGWKYPFAPSPKEFIKINLGKEIMKNIAGEYISDDKKYTITISNIENQLKVSRNWNNRSVYIIPTSNILFIDPSNAEEFKFTMGESENYTGFIIDNKHKYNKIK